MSDRRRFGSIGDFWPHYLAAHRHPSDRALHFLGTSALGLAIVGSLALEPIRMGVALATSLLLAAAGAWLLEPRRPAWVVTAAIVGLTALACPHFMIPGVALGYLFALVGHRMFERNDPTSTRYPLWSMFCDAWLFAIMASGRLWWGDAPIASAMSAEPTSLSPR